MPLFATLAICIVLYTLLLTLSSRASGKIDPFWSSTIFGATSTVAPLLIWTISRYAGKNMISTTPAGIFYSIAAGTSAGIFTALLVYAFQKGAVSYATPVIYGGAIALTAMVGYAFFQERISVIQAAGITCILIGIGLVVYSRTQGVSA